MKKALTGTALAIAMAFGAGSAAAEVKVGFMLPYSGTYAQLGEAIENGIFYESKLRSAPYFGLRIDGITELS